jgi:hypothetical protein
MESKNWMIHEFRQVLEGSGSGQIEALSRHLPGVTTNPQSGQPMSRPRFEPSTSRARYVNPWGVTCCIRQNRTFRWPAERWGRVNMCIVLGRLRFENPCFSRLIVWTRMICLWHFKSRMKNPSSSTLLHRFPMSIVRCVLLFIKIHTSSRGRDICLRYQNGTRSEPTTSSLKNYTFANNLPTPKLN